MRIVAGSHRGRRLLVPSGAKVRPTSDRAREAMFNIIFHGGVAGGRVPLAESTVLDAFAGTGALGLEALSRGAAGAVFIERDRDALAILRKNISVLGEDAHSRVIVGDATRPPHAVCGCAVVFIDPPYRSGLVTPALQALTAAGWFAPQALVVVELAAREEFAIPEGFTLLDERVYGAARIVFLRCQAEA
ncbi:MAG: 16S rRNA (guanine(966)-N(2))-methyltransferase RsmD [Alphaproteobacteria bacterium]|nr:16S rRNA (guanine(966)-N(2))-methyltransferase RsmD [Alphaproteobacteria bacterium]